MKCADGHEILAVTGLCKEDSHPPYESPTTGGNNAGGGNVDIQVLLKGLTSQLSEGMADSLMKALAGSSSSGKKSSSRISERCERS